MLSLPTPACPIVATRVKTTAMIGTSPLITPNSPVQIRHNSRRRYAHPLSPLALALRLTIIAGVGFLAVVQVGINVRLGDALGYGVRASFINFALALVLIMPVLVFAHRNQINNIGANNNNNTEQDDFLLDSAEAAHPRLGQPAINAAAPIKGWRERLKAAPAFAFTGGCFGAIAVTGSILLTPPLGLSLFYVCFVFGQMVASMVMDHLGLLGVPKLKATAIKLVGVLVALSGTVLMQEKQLFSTKGDAGELAAYMFLAVGSGTLVPMQAAVNGQLREYTPTNYHATAVSFSVGTAVLGLAFAVSLTASSIPSPYHSEWWMYLGGVCGALFIHSGIVFPSQVGMSSFTVMLVTGQLIGSLVLDDIGAFGLDRTPISLFRVAGALLSFIGASLVAAQRAKESGDSVQ